MAQHPDPSATLLASSRRPQGAGARVLRAALLALLPALSPCAHAQVYKWVDDQGVTHYSQSPPPGGPAKGAVLNLPGAATNPDAAGAGGNDNWQDQERAFRERQAKQADARKIEEERAQKEAASRRTACLRAREALDLLGRQMRLYNLNERGEKVYLSDDERARETQRASQQAAENCQS